MSEEERKGESMLQGIHPLLTGELLLHLDAMGHTDAVVVADAHFPAARLATRVVEMPGVGTPEVVAAIRSVLPLDEDPAFDLMQAPEGDLLEVQRQLLQRPASIGRQPGLWTGSISTTSRRARS